MNQELWNEEDIARERSKALKELLKPGLSKDELYRLKTLLYGLKVYEKCWKTYKKMCEGKGPS